MLCGGPRSSAPALAYSAAGGAKGTELGERDGWVSTSMAGPSALPMGLLQIQLLGTGPQSQGGERERGGILSAESAKLSFPIKISIFQEENLSL